MSVDTSTKQQLRQDTVKKDTKYNKERVSIIFWKMSVDAFRITKHQRAIKDSLRSLRSPHGVLSRSHA